MATQQPISSIIQIGEVSQYLAANGNARQNAFQNGNIDPRLPMMLYMERKAVQWMNTNSPGYSTLQGSANYLYSLYGIYGLRAITRLNQLTQTAPTITNPSNQSVNVGANATFTVSVTSTLAYTVQWFRNGVAIAGANSLSYTLTNAQLTDSGALFSATATSTAGSASSNTASLTVTAAITGSYYYGGTDYSSQLLANVDMVPYLGTFPITTGQPLSIMLPSGAANTYMVFRYPSSESVKTTYANAPLNNGTIPNISWNAVVTFGGYNYIFTRASTPFPLNSANPLIFS